MQSSGQQPKEKIERENAEVEDIKGQASSPLYEFPADQQGMVYPPPPSYYQNMQIPAERAALPLQPGNTSLPFQSSTPGSQVQLNQKDVQVPPYPPTHYPGMQPPIKKSYKWVWIIVSIFSVAFLVTCGLCGWGVYELFNSVIKQETGATDVVNNYFQDVQNQRYAHAYHWKTIVCRHILAIHKMVRFFLLLLGSQHLTLILVQDLICLSGDIRWMLQERKLRIPCWSLSKK